MSPSCILFGSIGTLTESSELQRQAFNLAFRQSGLDWQWDLPTYRRLLRRPGGLMRIVDYADAREEWVDAAAVYSRKVANFRQLALNTGLTPRPGVVELIAAARRSGVKLGWVTTTGTETLDLVSRALLDHLDLSRFDFIADRSMVTNSKPAPDIYRLAIAELGADPAATIAIEDTPEAAQSALGAGLTCYAFPGEAAAGRDFPLPCVRVNRVSADMVHGALVAA